MGDNLLINGVYWGYNPLILTIDPNFLGHPSTSLLMISYDWTLSCGQVATSSVPAHRQSKGQAAPAQTSSCRKGVSFFENKDLEMENNIVFHFFRHLDCWFYE